MCGRQVMATDFQGLFVLDTKNNKPITEEIRVADVSVFKAFSVRNKWLYRKLSELIIDNVSNVRMQHCLDNKYAHLQYSRLNAKVRGSNIQPFAIRSRSGRFVLPIGENIYSSKCSQKILQPVDLGNKKCYNSLAVMETNQDLTPLQERKVFFLSAHERILSPTAAEIPCSDQFAPKFKTADNTWISQTRNGIQKNKATIK